MWDLLQDGSSPVTLSEKGKFGQIILFFTESLQQSTENSSVFPPRSLPRLLHIDAHVCAKEALPLFHARHTGTIALSAPPSQGGCSGTTAAPPFPPDDGQFLQEQQRAAALPWGCHPGLSAPMAAQRRFPLAVSEVRI